MTDLLKALSAADEDYLVSISNRGIYKRACKDAESETPVYEETENEIKVITGGETVILSVPPEKSKCSCVSRSVCRHIVVAILFAKNNLCTPEGPVSEEKVSSEENNGSRTVSEDVSPEVKTENIKKEEPSVSQKKCEVLSRKETEKIRQCALDSLEILSDILRNGMTRLHSTSADSPEIAAVRCHSLKMADAERALRDVSVRLDEYIKRKSVFDMEIFTRKFFECCSMLLKLTDSEITENNLGSFRKSYEDTGGDLTILPVGMRSVSGGSYEGDVYYFLDITKGHESRFLSFSDIRPVFYTSGRSVRQHVSVPWDLNGPLKNMMRKKMVLRNAKISDGRLSSSKQTKLVYHSDALLDCEEIRNMIVFDFRQIVYELARKDTDNELETLFFICPEKFSDSRFDVSEQKYLMKVTDMAGNSVNITAGYTQKKDSFISQLETIGNRLTGSAVKKTVILVTASIKSGSLELFPVEFYDFITPPPYHEYISQNEDTGCEGYYSEILLEHIRSITGKLSLYLQCGISSSVTRDTQITDLTERLGMEHLSALLDDFYTCAERYRHTVEDTADEVLKRMASLFRYLLEAQKRLTVNTSLNKMR